MVHILAITKEGMIKDNLTIEALKQDDIDWYWVDFDCPDENESLLLDTHFHFHHLAIDDCRYLLQRPKLDNYERYQFFVFQALNENDMKPIEVDLFLSDRYVVTYHNTHLPQIEEVKGNLFTNTITLSEGSITICYQLLNKIVDYYFPIVYNLEDFIDEIGENTGKDSGKKLLDKIFNARADLLKVLRIVNQMEELVYHVLSAEYLMRDRIYFSNTHDHLLKLKEIIESTMAISSELRDGHIIYNSYRMNKTMTILTIFTVIFIPLTFIVGVYGMNFKYMPELQYRYGYFITLGLMAVLSIGMFLWFKKKGWFDMD